MAGQSICPWCNSTLPGIVWISNLLNFIFSFMWFVVTSYLPCPLFSFSPFMFFNLLCVILTTYRSQLLDFIFLCVCWVFLVYLLVCLLPAASLFPFAEKSISHSQRYLEFVLEFVALLKSLVCLNKFCKERNLTTAQTLWIELSSADRLCSCLHLPQIFPQGGWIPCQTPFVVLLHNRLLSLHLQKNKLTLDGCFHTLAWNLNPF